MHLAYIFSVKNYLYTNFILKKCAWICRMNEWINFILMRITCDSLSLVFVFQFTLDHSLHEISYESSSASRKTKRTDHGQNEWRFIRKTNVDSCAEQIEIHAQNEWRFMICAKRMDIHAQNKCRFMRKTNADSWYAQNEWIFMRRTNGDSCTKRMEIHAQNEWRFMRKANGHLQTWLSSVRRLF